MPDPPAQEGSPAAGSLRVVVIDDDPDFLDYVRIVLSSHGYDVLTASGAAVGLDLMRQDPPSLVILDVMMSYALDGWTVCHEMQLDPALSDVPLVMVSAVVTTQDDELFPSGANASMDAFLCKPVEPRSLLQCVRELTGSRRAPGQAGQAQEKNDGAPGDSLREG